METLSIKTEKAKQIVDITKEVKTVLTECSWKNGLCLLFIPHTTAAITTADLDPGTDLDMLDAFEKIVPKLNFRHPHNPAHTPSHILSSLIGASLTIPVKAGKLELGTWQRVVLVELDGPRQRSIVVSFLKGEE